MMDRESKRTIAVEDLLRLKRMERPAPEFWAEFDRELRAKQLAALVEKRLWWRVWPRAWRGIARYHFPLGATAVLAITLLSVRDYRPAAVPDPVTGAVEAVIPAAPEDSEPVVAVAEPVARARVVRPRAAVVSAPANSERTDADSAPAVSASELVSMVPTISAGAPSSRASERPSARSIAENRVAAEAMFGTPAAFEIRAISRPTPPEPLAQMRDPSELHRSRFAAAFASAAVASATVDSSVATTARLARRLSDEQLYDTIRRFGASGNSVSFKF